MRGLLEVGDPGDGIQAGDDLLGGGPLVRKQPIHHLVVLRGLRTTEVLGGKTSREVAEQMRILELGGVESLENIRNPIGRARASLLPQEARDALGY